MSHTAPKDSFYTFIDFYERGQFLEALHLVLPDPNVAYENLMVQEPLWHFLTNFVDASVFYGPQHAYSTNKTLQDIIEAMNPRQAILLTSFLEVLKWEVIFFQLLFLEQTEIKDQELFNLDWQRDLSGFVRGEPPPHHKIEKILQFIPPLYHSFITSKFSILKNWQSLKQFKPHFCHLLEEKQPISFSLPWHTFSYNLFIEPIPNLSPNQTPLIFLEPIADINYAVLLTPFLQQPILFVVQSLSTLLQMLQFPECATLLTDSKHYIYILELYPQNQFLAQKIKVGELQPILLVKNQIWEEAMPLFVRVLTQCLQQAEVDFQSDTPIANWLYQITQRICFHGLSKRYGSSRYIALKVEKGYQEWFSMHKGPLPKGADLGPKPEDYLEHQINQIKRAARPFAPQNKIRLAHVVPQVLGLGHAPTHLVFNLLTHADTHWFNLFLLSTERLVFHTQEYPISNYISSPSSLVGVDVLQYLASKDIHIQVEDQPKTFEETARHIAKSLKENKIDIVVFHGPDEINTLCSRLCDVPIRVLFEHGTLPTYPVFDLVILSTEGVAQEYASEYKKMGMETRFLDFGINAKLTWEPEPFSKEALGFPADSFIMTTISNHLDARLSTDMCHAIGKILQRYSNVYYAPMGKIHYPEKMRAIWNEYGVNQRITFLGHQNNPSQMARSMELYLNEFPFGSCLGMLNAMAAGCPVISMYDPQGPQQARYGAAYFGMERIVASGKIEDYVELACRLIQDQVLYVEWSEHAKAQYEKHADINRFVQGFEEIIEKFIEQKQNSKERKIE